MSTSHVGFSTSGVRSKKYHAVGAKETSMQTDNLKVHKVDPYFGIKLWLIAFGFVAFFIAFGAVGHTLTSAQGGKEKAPAKALKVTVLDDGKITASVVLQIEGEWKFHPAFESKTVPIREGKTIRIPGEHLLTLNFAPREKKFDLLEGRGYVELTLPDGAVLEYRPVEAAKRKGPPS